MRKIALTLTAASALALGACQNPQADQAQDQAETQTGTIDDQAGTMPEAPPADATQDTTGTMEPMAEDKAPATDDKGMTTPPKSDSDTPKTPPAEETK